VELRAAFSPPTGIPLFRAKIKRALDLVHGFDPRRLRRIQQDLRIILAKPGGDGYYVHALRMYVADWSDVIGSTPVQVALGIIHEATHARIADAGIPYTAERRARIEAICVKQEAAFARRLPGGEALARKRLENLAEPWWTPAKLADQALREARAEKVPGWAIRLLEWRYRRRQPSPDPVDHCR
jgi:hypothetical protein